MKTIIRIWMHNTKWNCLIPILPRLAKNCLQFQVWKRYIAISGKITTVRESWSCNDVTWALVSLLLFRLGKCVRMRTKLENGVVRNGQQQQQHWPGWICAVVKVPFSHSFFLVKTTMFNNDTVQVLTVILSRNWCSSQRGFLRPLSVFIVVPRPHPKNPERGLVTLASLCLQTFPVCVYVWSRGKPTSVHYGITQLVSNEVDGQITGKFTEKQRAAKAQVCFSMKLDGIARGMDNGC